MDRDDEGTWEVSLRAKIVEIVSRVLEVEQGEVPWEADLADVYDLDSLGRVEILAGLESNFDVDVPDEEVGDVRTMADAFRLMAELTGRTVSLD